MPVRLSDLSFYAVVLHFWMMWSFKCRDQFPYDISFCFLFFR